VTSLVRTRPGSARWLMRILDRPELVAAVRELPAPALASLIDRVGLEDAGELVALASHEQLQGVFDQDLWRARAPGEDEQFRPERFALWLEIMQEGGEELLIERLCALPPDLLTLAVQRLVLVVDMDALGEHFVEPTAELQRLEHALDAPLFEEWEEFRLLARDPMHWDAVFSALIALDRDHHDLLRAILERCCALSAEYIEEQGGLYAVLTSAEMLEGDVAGDREDRRAASGFVAPADARAFLALADRGGRSDARDLITRAYFRALAGREPERRAGSAPPASGVRQASGAPQDPPAGADTLALLLEEVAGVASPREPLAALPAGAGASDPVPLLRVALAELEALDPERFGHRVEELGYLANVLVAGSAGHRPRPVEALERAIAVCNRGLERALGADASLARAVALLGETPADLLFRRGYRD
jgi:hypothetical protein